MIPYFNKDDNKINVSTYIKIIFAINLPFDRMRKEERGLFLW